MKDLLPLKEAIYEVGLLFSKPSQPNDAQITAYARALSNYSTQQITHAFNMVVLDGEQHFPSLAQVLKHLRPAETSSEDLGNFVANEVIQKVKDYGSYRLREAMDALSDASKEVVKHNTYILYEIAHSDQDSLPTVRAQLRNLAKATAEAHKAGKKNDKLALLGIKESENVLSFRKPEMTKIDFTNVLPEGSA